MTQTTPGVCPAFVVAAEGYDRLMGRYLPSLGPAFADAAVITAGTAGAGRRVWTGRADG